MIGGPLTYPVVRLVERPPEAMLDTPNPDNELREMTHEAILMRLVQAAIVRVLGSTHLRCHTGRNIEDHIREEGLGILGDTELFDRHIIYRYRPWRNDKIVEAEHLKVILPQYLWVGYEDPSRLSVMELEFDFS